MLSAYSALNFGYSNERLIAAATKQLTKVTLTSRAFRNDQFGLYAKELCELIGYEMMLPMNSGAEAVETAIKAARKWGYTVKGVPTDQAQIIVCAENFHGRTTTIIGFSSEPQYRAGFGPFTPGFAIIPYGDAGALEQAMKKSQVVVIDCITLWITNLLLAGRKDEEILKELKKLCRILKRPKAQIILVSNEVGEGIVPADHLTRRFRDLQGKANQMLAQSCGEVFLLVAGIPLKIKGGENEFV
jgi:acetylornithine/succinyldiaminopimelate/putrescine aminotransferase